MVVKNVDCQVLVSHHTAEIVGKTILTTGVSPTSIGASFVIALAEAEPAWLILTGRSIAKLTETQDAIKAKYPRVKTRLLEMDLAILASVRKAAEELNSWTDIPIIDVVVNNAGIMAVPYSLTVDGYESQFAVNHLAHFLFVNLIMSKILAAPAPRLVCVTSRGHRFGGIRWGDINYENGYNKWGAYGQAKTANMLFALSLAEKLGSKGLLAFSVHPGTIYSTGLTTSMDMEADVALMKERDLMLGNLPATIEPISADQGAANYVYAAFEPILKDHNGAYLLQCNVGDPYAGGIMPWATSPIEADRLWKLSERLVGQEFDY